MKRARQDGNFVLSASKKTRHFEEHTRENLPVSPKLIPKSIKNLLSPKKSKDAADEKSAPPPQNEDAFSAMGMAQFLKLDVVTSAKTGRVRLRSQKDTVKDIDFAAVTEDSNSLHGRTNSARSYFEGSLFEEESPCRLQRGGVLRRTRGIARGTPVSKEQLRTPKRAHSVMMDPDESFESGRGSPDDRRRLDSLEELRNINIDIQALTERYSRLPKPSPANVTQTPGRYLSKSSAHKTSLDAIATPSNLVRRAEQVSSDARAKSRKQRLADRFLDSAKLKSPDTSSHDIDTQEIDINFKNLKSMFENKDSTSSVKSPEKVHSPTKQPHHVKYEFDVEIFEIKPMGEDGNTLEREHVVSDKSGVDRERAVFYTPHNSGLEGERGVSDTSHISGVVLRKPPLPPSTATPREAGREARSVSTPRQLDLQHRLQQIKLKLDMVRQSCDLTSPPAHTEGEGGALPSPHCDTPRPTHAPLQPHFIDAGTPSVSFKTSSIRGGRTELRGPDSPAVTGSRRHRAEHQTAGSEGGSHQQERARARTERSAASTAVSAPGETRKRVFEEIVDVDSASGVGKRAMPVKSPPPHHELPKFSASPAKEALKSPAKSAARRTSPVKQAAAAGKSTPTKYASAHASSHNVKTNITLKQSDHDKLDVKQKRSGTTVSAPVVAIDNATEGGSEVAELRLLDEILETFRTTASSAGVAELWLDSAVAANLPPSSPETTRAVPSSTEPTRAVPSSAVATRAFPSISGAIRAAPPSDRAASSYGEATRADPTSYGARRAVAEELDVTLSAELERNRAVLGSCASDDSLDDALRENVRYHTQPVESALGEEVTDRNPAAHARHHTQPVTPGEREAVMSCETETPLSAQRLGGSIADRLASLQKSGEEAWRRRVGKHESSPTKSTSPAKTLPNSNNNSGESPVPEPAAVEPVKLRTRTAELQQQSPGCTSSPEGTSPGGTSIASRLSWLGDAQQGWRDRVGEKDMARFTVHGKLSASNGAAVVCDSPLSRRVAAAGRNPLSRVTEDHVTESPLSAARGRDGPEESIAKSSPNIPATLSVVVQPSEVPSEPEDEAPAADSKTRQNTVSVARPDDETFTSFYDVRQSEVVLRNKVKVSVDDFDHLFMESENILTPTRGKARPQTRKNRASRNPVRALAARDDVQEEYREEIQGVAERELKRMKREQVVGKATLASEALAGLASTENFDKTKLRKAESFSGLSPGSAADKFLPYTDTMLLQVKGRRNCQTRLVAPTARSVNSGDAFVLVRPDRVFVWLGTYCNVIERAKAMDVASTIQQKRDLGCKSALEPIVLQETTGPPAGSTRDFWAALGGGHDQCQRPGPPDEDEVYEAYVNQTNMAYRVHGDKLVPVQTAWGQPLKHAMLEPKHMYVLDFGSEVYLWTGKQVAFASRKTGLGLLQEVWDKGYDYSSCDINPLSPLHTPEQGGMSAQSSERPAWALLGKVNQNMETVLFREKFSDWPEPGKLIRVQAAPDKQAKEEGAAELVPCDAAAMLARCDALVDLVLEGSHVGRGDQWLEREDAIERLFVVKTLGVTVWHVLEFETLDLPPASHGHFHEADTYVIKWSYRLMQAGIKSLKTKEFSSAATGRDKCAYFFWQGRLSSIAEKGASALMTVELDEERGPQVCVVQGKEPAAFLRLFHGTMATHLGKREDASTAPPGDWRLFLVRHEIAPESCLQEVPAQVQSLRSRASLLLLNTRMGQLITWHGAAAAADIRRNAAAAAQHIKTKKPAEMGVAVHKAVSVTEVEEGAEGSEFWAALGAVSRRERSGYHSHRGDPRPPTNAPRLWYLSSVSGAFEATELISPTRSADHVVPFTATQADLLKPQQPALFLVDDAWTVYVWQGAWPDAADDSSDVTTGSALSRFVADRACALQTALDYSKARGGVERTVLVYGGLEPLAFTNLFPDWATDARKRTKHLAEGHTDGETVDVGSLLRRLTDTRYSWAELTGPDAVAMETLPEGVDPARLEQWLRDDDFRSHLGVTREEFEMLPRWKKTALKRESGLF